MYRADDTHGPSVDRLKFGLFVYGETGKLCMVKYTQLKYSGYQSQNNLCEGSFTQHFNSTDHVQRCQEV